MAEEYRPRRTILGEGGFPVTQVHLLEARYFDVSFSN